MPGGKSHPVWPWVTASDIPPTALATKAFAYTSLAWLLAVAGLRPAAAAGLMVTFVALLCLLQAGVAQPVFGALDFVLALIGGLLVGRWMPDTDPAGPGSRR